MAQKMTKKAKPVVKAEPMTNTEEIVVEEIKVEKPVVEKAATKKTPKKFEAMDGVLCRSIVDGVLVMEGIKSKNFYKWADMKKLVTYGMEKYHWKEYADLPEAKEIEILNGIPEDENLFENAIISTRIEQKKDEKVLLHDEEEIDILIEQVNELHAPVTEGRKVGRVVYLLNSEILTEYPIVLTKSIPEKSLQWYFQKIVELYVRK